MVYDHLDFLRLDLRRLRWQSVVFPGRGLGPCVSQVWTPATLDGTWPSCGG